MATVEPKRIQEVVKDGYNRMQRYRKANALFVKEYVGQYYRENRGLGGDEPVNLLFSAIRALVPNIVNNNPVNQVVTEVIDHKPYAELLSLALDSVGKRSNLKGVLRASVTNALFMMGIAKVGIAASGNTMWVGDRSMDPGEVYIEMVDLDDFVIDPNCKSLKHSRFYGHRLTVPRRVLLDNPVYDKKLVKKLPSLMKEGRGGERSVADLSRDNGMSQQMIDMEDLVHVVELWIPDAEAIVTIPDPNEATFDDFISAEDYYGPDSGPYAFLSLTPPVSGNPLPVAPVSVYYDLHRAANRVFKKVLDQSERQKDVLLYDPAHADVAQDIVNAEDGDTIAATDPSRINQVSLGGQNRENAAMLQQLQIWFNYMAGNPDQLAGSQSAAISQVKTATQAQILQSNASISIEDVRDLTYDFASDINGKVAWYLHTDPLIELPLSRRTEYGNDEQLVLTPEQRRGDWLEFTFKIKPKSMSMIDPQVRSQRIMQFATNIIPQAAMAATAMLQMGQPFNLQRYLTLMANELEIGEWVQELFQDPQFEQRLQMMMTLGPQNPGKAQGVMSTAQNGGFPVQRNVMTPGQQMNSDAQQGAVPGQQMLQMGGGAM